MRLEATATSPRMPKSSSKAAVRAGSMSAGESKGQAGELIASAIMRGMVTLGELKSNKESVRVMAGIAMGLKCPVCAAEDRADSE